MDRPVVLVLEDDADWRALHVIRLAAAGFEVVSTDSGREAVELATTRKDIVAGLVDLLLEEPDGGTQDLQGEDVINEIKARRPADWPEVRFVVVSGVIVDEGQREIAELLARFKHLFVVEGVMESVMKLLREMARLSLLPGVVDVVHKPVMDGDRDAMYARAVELLAEEEGDPGATR